MSAGAGVAATEQGAPRPGDIRAIAAVVRDPEFARRLADVRRVEAKRAPAPTASALFAAALALPGMLPVGAAAQAVADHGTIELKYLDYRDWQPGASRMTVRRLGRAAVWSRPGRLPRSSGASSSSIPV